MKTRHLTGRWLATTFIIGWTVLNIGACASMPSVRGPGGERWSRAETEHFRVYADFGDDAHAVRLAQELELLYSAFDTVPYLGLGRPEQRATVAVFKSPSAFKHFAGAAGGVYFDESLVGPLILLPRRVTPLNSETLKHELTHYMMAPSMSVSLEWLGEGVAGLMETAVYDPDGERVIFGTVSNNHVRRAAQSVRPGEFMTEAWPDEPNPSYYGGAWLLVHYLVDLHREAFTGFLEEFASGGHWEDAWDRHLSVPREDTSLDERLDSYADAGEFMAWQVPVASLANTVPTTGVATDAEIHLLLAALTWHGRSNEPDTLEVVTAHLESAKNKGPTSPQVSATSAEFERQYAQSQGTPPLPRSEVDRVLGEAQPDLNTCFLTAEDGPAGGKLTFSGNLRLERDGRVGDVRFAGVNRPAPKTLECVRRTLSELLFPAPRYEFHALTSFMFFPQNDGKPALSLEQIGETMASAMENLTDCYENAADGMPHGDFKVRARFYLERAGPAQRIEFVSQNREADRTLECLRDRIAQIEFPAPLYPSHFSYGWSFFSRSRRR
ncbi:MAG: hypothetical protein AAFU77_01360 [Myxococcota bacterium]